VVTGAALPSAAVAAAASDPVTAGAVRLLRLGQAGLVVRGAGTTVVVDPFLSDHPDRLVPAVPPEAITACDLVLVTHAHDDHLDPPTLAALAAAHPQCRFAAPAICAPLLVDAGIEPARIDVVAPGDEVRGGAARATAVAAWHAETPDRPQGYGEDGRTDFLGFVIALGGVTVFHAGDTLWWDGLAEAVAPHAPDLALLPVNGRDVLRDRAGIVGCLNPREAVHLAAAVGAAALVPIHHDLFAANPGDPAAVVACAAAEQPGLQVLVLPAHRPLTYVPR
jgi:L-ascorbate metabolism protein UlaG (beta-lactamase superfamily)